MHLIVWEYRVKAACTAEFEKIYGNNGDWVELFQRESGYAGTELLHNEQDPQRYITIDRWTSQEAYDRFHVQHQDEYESLDIKCQGLTESEFLLGKWHTQDYETR
jgi:heme-degrading monooxygenase HmoA